VTGGDPKVYVASSASTWRVLQEDTIRRFALSALNAGKLDARVRPQPCDRVPGFFDPASAAEHAARRGRRQRQRYWIKDTAARRRSTGSCTLAPGQVPGPGT